MSRFLAIGDLHLGAGSDYGREPGDRLRDQEAVWSRALELAAEHDVDAVLFAGDAFHRHVRTPAELRAFQRPLEAFAAEHDIELLGIPGNHDIESASASCVLEVFGRDIDMHFEPGIWLAPGGTSVATLPWTPVTRLIASRGGGDRDENHDLAAQLLIETARDLRARIDGPAVLMLHWSVSGAATPTGVMTDEFRETVIPLHDLEGLGFDAVVAGHIHKYQHLTDSDRIFYVGSPMPVDFSEGNAPHGCMLIEVGPDVFEGFEYQFLPIESRAFVTVDLEADEAVAVSTGDHDFSARSEYADAVIRVRYTATEEQARRINHAEITKALYDAGAAKVYAIQPTILRENRSRVEGVNEDVAPLDAVQMWATANEVDGDVFEALAQLTTIYLRDVTA